MSLDTPLTRRYGVPHPFVGAGMAFASQTPDLAIAVSNAGGIGPIGVGFSTPEVLRETIQAVRAGVGDRPFHVNFITCFDNEALVPVCVEEQVPIVSWHWGHPSERNVGLLREAGIAQWEQVGTTEAARRAVDDGFEGIVAQGWEAGGHNYGGLPTFVLVPELRDALGDEVLLLASGGVVDGRAAAAALCLGADGVWVGTRLLATPEAYVHPEHHRRLLESTGTDTVRSGVFGPEMPDFNPMRLQRNRVVADWTDRLAEVPTDRSAEPVIGETVFLGGPHVKRKFDVLLPTEHTTGDFEEMAWLMGQGVGRVRDIRPAAEVVETMMAEAARLLGR